MPGLLEQPTASQHSSGPEYSVSAQHVHLDIDFLTRGLRGHTEILIQPHTKELKVVRLNCRQCVLTRLNIEGKSANITYNDPYSSINLHSSVGVHQYHILQKRIRGQLRTPPEDELIITLPKSVRIGELDPFSAAAGDVLLSRLDGVFDDKVEVEPAALVQTPMLKADDGASLLTPLKINIEFFIEDVRAGLHFVGLGSDDARYPHVYSTNSKYAGSACALFPCVDDPLAKCPWEISIRCPRTLGHAFERQLVPNDNSASIKAEGNTRAQDVDGVQKSITSNDLNKEEKMMDLTVTCSGNMTDEIVDTADPTRKTVHFACTTPVAPQHIGFAIGPFEYVDLSEYRESDEDEKLGQNAVRVHGFCLPGRGDEVRNTCVFLAKAVDHFVMTYGSYPFSSYKLCFVDDLAVDVVDAASLSICSNRILYPEDILDPIDEITRTIIHALASQWLGVNIIMREPADTWIIVACSYFMTDFFLEDLFGRNDFRYRQRVAADRLFELDVHRPSLFDLGSALACDNSELEFMILKAPLILFMLHQRLSAKAATKSGVNRIIWRLCLNAKTGDLQNGAVSTAYFLRVSEKAAHGKLDAFFNQWVFGAGCPHFLVTQRFNKKKLIVEMLIKQVQAEETNIPRSREPQNFRREVKEYHNNIIGSPVQPLFTGSMTIRIHEADGTPYEHIVDINEVSKKVEIPYNTKYKRLKRSRRQKERAAIAAGLDISGDNQDDVLLYCLGDVLQSEQEVADWKLIDWSGEDENRMSQESYEWIRIDAEFEWIAKISFNMPRYMYVSQLQQDRDVVAQLESIQYLGLQKPDPMISSILVRTLMDRRYYHGIRTSAAISLVKCATVGLGWIGLFHLEKTFHELYCFPGSSMTRSNDFSDRISYIIQCAIPKAIAQVRDSNGKAPARVKSFLADKLKFNDNSNNRFSDCFYVSTLLTCFTEALVQVRQQSTYTFNFDSDEEEEAYFRKDAINVIERYGRIDEWISSFHNLYSTTVMHCMQRLMENNVIDRRTTDFLQYSRIGNLDVVRLKAFDCLIRLGMMCNSAFVSYTLSAIENDSSPYFRKEILGLFWQGLGTLVINQTSDTSENGTSIERQGNLIIEQQTTTENKTQDLARARTVPGILEELRKKLGEDDEIKQALRGVLSSDLINLQEFGEILEICSYLYEPITSLIVVLKYPRYWAVKHIGNGILHFRETSKVRTKPLAKPESSPQNNKTTKPSGPSLIIRHQSSGNLSETLKPPSSSSTTTTSLSSAQTLPSLKIARPAPAPAPAPALDPTPLAHPSLSVSSSSSFFPPQSGIQPHSNRTVLKLSTKSLATLKKQSTQQQEQQGGAPSFSSTGTVLATETAIPVPPGPEVNAAAAATAATGNTSIADPPAPSASTTTTPLSSTAQPKIPKLKLRVGSFAASAASATSTPRSTSTSTGHGLKRKSP